ncbi:MAG: IcmT/TraK family protein [Rhodobacteraceae bacterium]|nr:IcmT/TraK family protein [Paracoccaceae bacterium]
MLGKRNYWRDAQRPARFLCFDSRIVAFIGLTLLHFRVWTVILLILAAVVLLWMDWRSIDPRNSLRHLRTFLAGPVIRARRHQELRRPIDFGFETIAAVRQAEAELQKNEQTPEPSCKRRR